MSVLYCEQDRAIATWCSAKHTSIFNFAMFSAVAEQSSFEGGGEARVASGRTVSRSIAQLEEILGELLHRTTHHVSRCRRRGPLHERTRGHHHRALPAVVDPPEREGGAIRSCGITAAPDFWSHRVAVGDRPRFNAASPSVRFDIRLSGQQIDPSRDGYDSVIRVALPGDVLTCAPHRSAWRPLTRHPPRAAGDRSSSETTDIGSAPRAVTRIFKTGARVRAVSLTTSFSAEI